jgi:hypothetical protein
VFPFTLIDSDAMARHGCGTNEAKRGAKGSPRVCERGCSQYLIEVESSNLSGERDRSALEKGEKLVGSSGSHTMRTNKGEEQRGKLIRARARGS